MRWVVTLPARFGVPSPKIRGRLQIAMQTRNTHSLLHSPTTRVIVYNSKVSSCAGAVCKSEQIHSVLNPIQTIPQDRRSSKKDHRQVSKLRRTHHHGLSINKPLALHRNNGSVIFITSDSSSPSIYKTQNFPERTRLRQWPSASCEHKLYTRP